MSIKLIIYLVERDGFVTKGLTIYIYIYIYIPKIKFKWNLKPCLNY